MLVLHCSRTSLIPKALPNLFWWWIGGHLSKHIYIQIHNKKYNILPAHRWFEIITCKANRAIYSQTDERLHWLTSKFIPYLTDWQVTSYFFNNIPLFICFVNEDVFFRQNEVEIIYPGENKRIMSKTTLHGMIFTTLNMIALTKRLLAGGLKFVCLGTLTQDVLEAVFGNLVIW